VELLVDAVVVDEVVEAVVDVEAELLLEELARSLGGGPPIPPMPPPIPPSGGGGGMLLAS